MAALSADLLGALGDPTGQFCLYKSVPSMLISALFIVTCTTCVCACFTVIACVQIIIFQSQRAIFSRSMVHRVQVAATQSFIKQATRNGRMPTRSETTKSVNVTWRVVRMTQLLIYGDRSAIWDVTAQGHSRKSAASLKKEANDRNMAIGGFTIYMGLAIALTCFFASTIIVILIFVSPLASWRRLDESAYPANNTLPDATQEYIVQMRDGRAKTRCLDPYDPADESSMLLFSWVISTVSTSIFITNVVIGVRTAARVSRCYKLEALLSLPDEEEHKHEPDEDFEAAEEHQVGQLENAAGRHRFKRENRVMSRDSTSPSPRVTSQESFLFRSATPREDGNGGQSPLSA